MEALKISQAKIRENQSLKNGCQTTNEILICDKHGEFQKYRTFITGKLIKQSCPSCGEEANAERERQSEARARSIQLETYRRKANIPKRFAGLDINNINLNYHKKPEDNKKLQSTVKIVKGYLKTYPERLKKGASGFFCGECGTGKTMLACMMVENIINQLYSAQYITAWQMIQEIRKGYGKYEESISDYIKEFINKSFLVIDEVGVQHGTDDERILLYQVIDGRYNEVKPTIIISNSMNPVEDGYLDLRTIDRLREGGGFSITFNGESYRK